MSKYHELSVGWDSFCGCDALLATSHTKPLSVNDSLKRAFHVSRKIVINTNLQGSVDITRIIQLETASCLFVLGVSLLWIFKGPRLSSEHYEVGLFFPIGIHTYPSWLTVVHVYFILGTASLISLMSWNSLLMRKTCKWKLVTLRTFVMAALIAMLIEIVFISPVCSTVAPITFDTIKNAVKSSLVTYQRHIGGFEKLKYYWNGSEVTEEPSDSEFDEVTPAPRALLPEHYSRFFLWIINSLGGCERIHSSLWSFILLTFSYSWCVLSLISFPFSFLQDVSSVYDMIYWIQPKNLEPNIRRLNDLTYIVHNRFETATITVESIQDQVPNGQGTIAFSHPKTYDLMTGTWKSGVFCSPFVYKNDKFGIIRSFSHIHLDLFTNGDIVAYNSSLTVVGSRMISDTVNKIWTPKSGGGAYTDVVDMLKQYRTLWKGRNILVVSRVGNGLSKKSNIRKVGGAAGGIANRAGVYLNENADSELSHLPFVLSINYTGGIIDRIMWKYWRCDYHWQCHDEFVESLMRLLMKTSDGVSFIVHGMSSIPIAKTLNQLQISVDLEIPKNKKYIPRIFAITGLSDILGSSYFPTTDGGLMHLRMTINQIKAQKRPVIFACAEDTSTWRRLMIQQMGENMEEAGPLLMIRMESFGSDHFIEFTLRQLSATLRKVPISLVKFLSSFYGRTNTAPLGLTPTDLRQLGAYMVEEPQYVLRQKILLNTYLY